MTNAARARKRTWNVGFGSLCLAQVAQIVGSPWLLVGLYGMSIASLLRIAQLDRASRASRPSAGGRDAPASEAPGHGG
jgi:hypothetical protein